MKFFSFPNRIVLVALAAPVAFLALPEMTTLRQSPRITEVVKPQIPSSDTMANFTLSAFTNASENYNIRHMLKGNNPFQGSVRKPSLAIYRKTNALVFDQNLPMVTDRASIIWSETV